MGEVPDTEALRVLLVGGALTVARMLGMMQALPFFPSGMQATLRHAIACVLALPVLPATMASLSQQPSPPMAMLLMLIAKEALLGFLLGYAIAIPFHACEAMGNLIDNQRGAAVAEAVNPMNHESSSPLGVLLHQCFTVLFLALAGFQGLLGTLYESYLVWPPLHLGPTLGSHLVQHYLGLLDHLMSTAVRLAAPVMAAMLVSEMALAIVSMFAPQLQVFVLAMPIKSGVALFVLVVYFMLLGEHMAPEVVRVTTDLLPGLKAALP